MQYILTRNTRASRQWNNSKTAYWRFVCKCVEIMLARSSFTIYMRFNRYRTCRARVCAITIIERAMDYTRSSDKPSHERKCYFFLVFIFSPLTRHANNNKINVSNRWSNKNYNDKRLEVYFYAYPWNGRRGRIWGNAAEKKCTHLTGRRASLPLGRFDASKLVCRYVLPNATKFMAQGGQVSKIVSWKIDDFVQIFRVVLEAFVDKLGIHRVRLNSIYKISN